MSDNKGKSCPHMTSIGGQAVIEGVMMRHDEDIAVAVRRPDGQIEVGKSKFESILDYITLGG